jgi:alpha-L-fucosidase
MPAKPEPTVGDTSWFVNDRFGMFIHWGLYALPARHEWVKNRERMDDVTYQKYFNHFNPDLFDPIDWARSARDAGMKYFVITTKHHEGFCLWDSKFTDYKATNTPCGKDLLTQVVDAFRAEGLKIGFYYSLLDWHHPDFPIDGMHPLRDHPNFEQLNQGRDIKKYAIYMQNQIRELLTIYSPVDILWLDFSYPDQVYKGMPGKGKNDWMSEELYKLVRQLAPRIVMNNRLDYTDKSPDIYTPEQVQPTEWVKVNGKNVVWEACQTFSGSWGYHRDEATWKSPEQLIQMLVNTVSCGGNLLMNVGPTARGTFDDRAKNALSVYKDWMKLHGKSIYGCTQSDFKPPTDVRYTQNGRHLYAHIFTWPFRQLVLPGLAGKVEYIQMLHDASEILYRESGDVTSYDQITPSIDNLVVNLPVEKPKVVVPVLEIFLKD